MSSIDKAVMLEALGWSRGGKENKHLPDDIVNIINQFTFFDTRTEAYRFHFFKKGVKEVKLKVLDNMMFQINDGLRRFQTGKYGVEYNSSNCCTICGNFVELWDRIPENIRCSCRFLTEEEIMEIEYERPDNFFPEEEEDAEREKERRRKNREEFGDNWWCDSESNYDPDLDYEYSDRKINWDDGSEDDDDYYYDDYY